MNMNKTLFATVCILGLLLPLASAGFVTTSFFGHPIIDSGISRKGGVGWITPSSLFSATDPLDEDFWTPYAKPRQMMRLVDEIANNLLIDSVMEPVISSRKEVASATNGTETNATDTRTIQPRARKGMLRRPKFDWRETDDGYVLTALTPGLKKDEISLEVVEGRPGAGLSLVVSGETKHDDKGDDKDGAKWHSSSYEHFENRIRIPEGIDRDSIEAKYEEGALTVNIKAAKEKKVETRKIAIA
eukprot:CAMPEP_0173388618 /NCGR_PEP_ID=MMETSP1356-20130122/10878_1 /TAXON_ID=77927 ORGANISM="Hemiselmis virescens, Strain PCC157" /NCGR_SAMPLE_ID=MMETSP1356 /ASSEMBLY_ACC=CAM_ASM_000847 /LENGTH=243 /DNA_ID=CAMNT_0014345569 /DNA_START=593 /DNA_END=1324 /DNA_ORIENTATION=+